MRTNDEMLAEIEHANAGEGPEPIRSIIEPELSAPEIAWVTQS